MKTAYDLLRENFERWEIRGRGVLTFPQPVSPRPPFAPFPGHKLKAFTKGADSARPTKVSGFLSRVSSLIRGSSGEGMSRSLQSETDEDDLIEPHGFGKENDPLVEFKMRLPEDFAVHRESMTPLLMSLGQVGQPLVFEIVGTADETWVQWAADARDAPDLQSQMQAHFPEVKLTPSKDALERALHHDREVAVVEFALGEPFMLPLASVKHDPFVALIGALSSLGEDEAGLYQVIFTPLDEPWAVEMKAAVTKSDGRPFFDDGAVLMKGAEQKTQGPLFGVVVRLAGIAPDYDRAWEVLRSMAPALLHFTQPGANVFVPLRNDDYEEEAHVADILTRRTRRCGMLLNLDELTGLVHLPSAAVQSARFERIGTNTRRAVPSPREGVCLGVNHHDGVSNEVWLSHEQRVRHLHVIGGTGTGKSTLLFSMIQQDIKNGEGVAVLDPHGDLVDKILGIIPAKRINDVVLLDPSDEQFILPFNILSAHSDFEKMLLASDLVSVFQRLSTSWGDQMNSVFRQAVFAFLESTQGGTLSDLRRFLLDPAYREQFLQTVTDADVRFYWKRGFAQLGGNKSIGPVLTRLETLLSPKPLRLMLSQKENKLDFGDIMDSGKIFLARIPQGQIGRENAFLFGSLVISKIQQMAMSRQRMSAKIRRPFFCYVDEFQNFITPSMAEILSSARKYRMGLVLAHQELRQLEKDKEVASAVLANAFTRVVFRVSDADARALGEGFMHFEPRDLQNLQTGEAICRIERADGDFNLRIPPPAEVDEADAERRREQVIARSRAQYAVPRAEVDAMLLQKLEAQEAALESAPLRREAKKAPEAEPQTTRPEPVEEVEPVRIDAPVAAQVPVADAEPLVAQTYPKPSGMGRGGQDHQMLVDQIWKEGSRLGYRTSKESEVAAGRVDVLLERRDCRIAIEVAVNSNTSHELDNLRKGLVEGFHFVVSVSPLPNFLENIRRAAARAFAVDEMEKLKFFAPDELLQWLGEQASVSETVSLQPTERRIGGRRVRVKHLELSAEDRRKIENESIAALADILSKSQAQTGEQ